MRLLLCVAAAVAALLLLAHPATAAPLHISQHLFSQDLGSSEDDDGITGAAGAGIGLAQLKAPAAGHPLVDVVQSLGSDALGSSSSNEQPETGEDHEAEAQAAISVDESESAADGDEEHDADVATQADEEASSKAEAKVLGAPGSKDSEGDENDEDEEDDEEVDDEEEGDGDGEHDVALETETGKFSKATSVNKLMAKMEQDREKLRKDRNLEVTAAPSLVEVILHSMHRTRHIGARAVVRASDDDLGTILDAAQSFISFDLLRFLPNRVPQDKQYLACMERIAKTQNVADTVNQAFGDNFLQATDTDAATAEDQDAEFAHEQEQEHTSDNDNSHSDASVEITNASELTDDEGVGEGEGEGEDEGEDGVDYARRRRHHGALYKAQNGARRGRGRRRRHHRNKRRAGKMLKREFFSPPAKPFPMLLSPPLFELARVLAKKCFIESRARTIRHIIKKKRSKIRNLFVRAESPKAAKEVPRITAKIKKLRNSLIPYIRREALLLKSKHILGRMVSNINWESRFREAIKHKQNVDKAQFIAAKRLRDIFLPDGSRRFPKDPGLKNKYVRRLRRAYNKEIRGLARQAFSRKVKYFMNRYLNAGNNITPNYQLPVRLRYKGRVIGAGTGAGANEYIGKGSDFVDRGYDPEPHGDVFPHRRKLSRRALQRLIRNRHLIIGYKGGPGTITPQTRT